jgi:hypothetical protein
LEQASGAPSADIRLTTELQQKLRQKIAALGLDPADTTGPELYNALQDRLRQDEQRVREALHIAVDATPAQILLACQKYLQKQEAKQTCFALKANVAKKMLKKKPPKITMKQLGYRSVDSMLKHESAAALLAAAQTYESATWRRNLYDQYAKLHPSDFEQRAITIECPKTRRWIAAATTIVQAMKQNIICLNELGTIVILPMEEHIEGAILTTVLISLNSLNDIRAQSSFAKLQQVRPDFGKVMQRTAAAEPITNADLAGQPVSWRMIQRFYGRFVERYHPEVFEPHVQPEDLQWRPAEDALALLDPALAFWQDTQYLALLDDDGPVSCNALDVALSFCNQLPFPDRIVHFLRDNLWHELMMRYLHQENLEEAVHRQLSSELIDEQAIA